jgi:MFS family permease
MTAIGQDGDFRDSDLPASHDDAGFARAGRLACFCPPGAPSPGGVGLVETQGCWSPGVATLAGGFALSVLSQSLTLGLLPLAGRLLAPSPHLMSAPYIAMLLGAALATFPASFLLDAFGRRAALALGASLGIAGGLIMAWGLSRGLFPPFCLGAFWLGVAQGFSLFYRHEAALGSSAGGRARAALIVFGSGAASGLIGPAFAALVARSAPEQLFAATALAAAGAQVLVLVLAVFATARAPVLPAPARRANAAPNWSAFIAPSLIAALAWFGMTAAMVGAPGAMSGCGIAAPAVFSVVSWHVIAMYGPAFFAGALARRLGAEATAGLGLALIAGAWGLEFFAGDYWRFAGALIMVAVGWSLATSGASLRLYSCANPSRAMLAAHDALLFVSAMGGALAAAFIPI